MSSSHDLHTAARNMDIDEAKRLIANGAEINALDGMSRTALHIAAWKGDSEMVQLLIRSKASTAVKAKDQFTALHFAVQSGSVECCRLLLEQNKNLANMRVSKGNKTPLHIASSKGNHSIISLLLESGVDPTAVTSKKQTALDLAKDDEVFQLIKGFIENKVKSNISCNARDDKDEVLVADSFVSKKRPLPSLEVEEASLPDISPDMPASDTATNCATSISTDSVIAPHKILSAVIPSDPTKASAAVVKIDLSKRRQKKKARVVQMTHLYADDSDQES